MPIQTPNIPRVCLCGQARSGTSMMMRVLQAGGLTIDTDGQIPDDQTIAIMRQPHGFFENRPAIIAQNFVNSFKLLDYNQFNNVPKDYKFIYIGRNINGITKSWQTISSNYFNIVGGSNNFLDQISLITSKKVAWENIISLNPGFLILDYDTVCADPITTVKNIGMFLNTTNFTFNETSAAQAIDTILYINRI